MCMPNTTFRSKKLNLFADLQYRKITIQYRGIDNDLRNINQEHNFNFFNPKLGIFYQPASNQNLYLSFAVANREPNRDNYVDANPEGKTTGSRNPSRLGNGLTISALSILLPRQLVLHELQKSVGTYRRN